MQIVPFVNLPSELTVNFDIFRLASDLSANFRLKFRQNIVGMDTFFSGEQMLLSSNKDLVSRISLLESGFVTK